MSTNEMPLILLWCWWQVSDISFRTNQNCVSECQLLWNERAVSARWLLQYKTVVPLTVSASVSQWCLIIVIRIRLEKSTGSWREFHCDGLRSEVWGFKMTMCVSTYWNVGHVPPLWNYWKTNRFMVDCDSCCCCSDMISSEIWCSHTYAFNSLSLHTINFFFFYYYCVSWKP